MNKMEHYTIDKLSEKAQNFGHQFGYDEWLFTNEQYFWKTMLFEIEIDGNYFYENKDLGNFKDLEDIKRYIEWQIQEETK